MTPEEERRLNAARTIDTFRHPERLMQRKYMALDICDTKNRGVLLNKRAAPGVPDHVVAEVEGKLADISDRKEFKP